MQPVLVIACGAIAKEILNIIELNKWKHIELKCLDADLHNRPKLIAPKLREKIDSLKKNYAHIMIGYGDCGSGGDIDRLIQHYTEQGLSLSRIEGAHCYQFFLGNQNFVDLEEEQLGNFYLTDFLVTHFQRIIVGGFKLDKHPELKPMLFNNYRKVVFLSQIQPSSELLQQAQSIADFLELPLHHIHSGYGDLTQALRLQQE